MTRHEHAVVVGVDWSDSARAAIEHGAAAAAERNLPLRLVHVLEPPLYAARAVRGAVENLDLILRKAGQRLLDEAVQVLALTYPGLRVATALRHGSAVDVLVDESRSAERLVLGTRGVGVFS